MRFCAILFLLGVLATGTFAQRARSVDPSPSNKPAPAPSSPAQTVKAEAVVPPPAPVADVSAKTRVREAFAQLVAPEPKKPEAKPQRKRKIARSRVAPPMIQVAQQPRFGFFNAW